MSTTSALKILWVPRTSSKPSTWSFSKVKPAVKMGYGTCGCRESHPRALIRSLWRLGPLTCGHSPAVPASTLTPPPGGHSALVGRAREGREWSERTRQPGRKLAMPECRTIDRG
jgi:hypothetical protein